MDITVIGLVIAGFVFTKCLWDWLMDDSFPRGEFVTRIQRFIYPSELYMTMTEALDSYRADPELWQLGDDDFPYVRDGETVHFTKFEHRQFGVLLKRNGLV